MTAPTLAEPPLCNTGANPLSNRLTWDWYQATIKALTSPYALLELLATVNGPGSQWKATKGLYGYSSGRELLGLEVGSVKVFFGGEDVHVQATSGVAESVVNLLREHYPDHTVSRADVAWDTLDPGSFDRLYARVHDLARDGAESGGRKVSTSTAGDWLDRIDGRTFYAGGTSSRLRVVVYEKGHEQTAKDPNCGADLNWTRVEWRLRPTSDQKVWLSRASKVEALGLTPFGAAVAADLLGLDVEPVGASLRFASQDPGYWMVHQYRNVVLELLALDPSDMAARLVELVDLTAPRPA